MAEDVEKIIIPDEEGNEEVFEVLYKFDVEQTGKQYMMVIPVDGDPEVDEVYAFRYEENGDDLSLFIIEDDKEWEIVESTFQTLIEEEDL
ncbi:DUF1292 domain-containing protein [Caldalkalibacillus salinus]|uniref:DUF1292 domain-containing protein n=1 Tax=Caldalkalibacillus salinus TaxID=2803787 RepID=UPI001921704B|nr:DUF1292 domain-containing protein [Caldalkalibacillus salinus]